MFRYATRAKRKVGEEERSLQFPAVFSASPKRIDSHVETREPIGMYGASGCSSCTSRLSGRNTLFLAGPVPMVVEEEEESIDGQPRSMRTVM